MIIEKENSNNIILTVSERVTIVNPFYLFHLKSKFNNTEERLFFATNISNNKLRYDEFVVTEMTNPDYLIGQVDLFTGEWQYTVYQTSTQTLDLNLVDKELQTGLLIVTDENYN